MQEKRKNIAGTLEEIKFDFLKLFKFSIVR